MTRINRASIPQQIRATLLALPAFLPLGLSADDAALQASREAFKSAWESARSGDRQDFHRLGPGLRDYRLYPYWQYEDYRHRRAQVPPAELDAFLDAHADWAFTPALRKAWLRSLGERRQWPALVEFGQDESDAELRCYATRARLATGALEGVRAAAEDLWAAPRSQPKACDPLFDWLIKEHGIDPELAWKRIRRAFEAGNPRLTLYLSRFLPPDDRHWLERWQRLNRDRYHGLERASTWPDLPRPAMIAAVSLTRLAHYDAGQAWDIYGDLEDHFSWSSRTRGEVLREIALMGAVELNPDGLAMMHAVPPAYRTEQLLQWWMRLGLSQQNWTEVLVAIGQMAAEEASDDRWRFWQAHARAALGEAQAAQAVYAELAQNATYYGFLAADRLQRPYTICPQEPGVDQSQVSELRAQADFDRALELQAVGLDNWALAEWGLATGRLPPERLKVAAALALEEGWSDRAIYALGNSGELRYYDWRFPVIWRESVEAEAARNDLDPAWVYGVMRSESAMTEAARSSAGALGLMQVLPATARQISKQHGIAYRGQSQLLQGDENIRFGTVYLRELMNRFGQNPVLVSGAYNAGPHVVDRWLAARDLDDPQVWVETLPYYETRDYIPRVLAFTTIYDWRLRNPVRRVSSRMPGIESGTIASDATTEVVCQAPQLAGS